MGIRLRVAGWQGAHHGSLAMVRSSAAEDDDGSADNLSLAVK
jgi:hypothetical protein